MASILSIARPSNIQNWVATNAAGSLKATPRESWRAYLASVGGVGNTLGDLERSATLSISGGGNTRAEKIRNTFK